MVELRVLNPSPTGRDKVSDPMDAGDTELVDLTKLRRCKCPAVDSDDERVSKPRQDLYIYLIS